MLDLPRRKLTIEVPIRDGVTIELATMSDQAFIALVGTATFMGAIGAADKEAADKEAADKEADKEAARAIIEALPIDKLVGAFAGRVRSVSGVTVDEEPFDPAAEGHAESVPMPWKILAMSELFAHQTALPADVAGNSSAPPATRRAAPRSRTKSSGRGRPRSSKASSGSSGKG